MPQLDFGVYYPSLGGFLSVFVLLYLFLVAGFLVDLGGTLKLRTKILRQTRREFSSGRRYSRWSALFVFGMLDHVIGRRQRRLYRWSHLLNVRCVGSTSGHLLAWSDVFRGTGNKRSLYYFRPMDFFSSAVPVALISPLLADGGATRQWSYSQFRTVCFPFVEQMESIPAT